MLSYTLPRCPLAKSIRPGPSDRGLRPREVVRPPPARAPQSRQPAARPGRPWALAFGSETEDRKPLGNGFGPGREPRGPSVGREGTHSCQGVWRARDQLGPVLRGVQLVICGILNGMRSRAGPVRGGGQEGVCLDRSCSCGQDGAGEKERSCVRPWTPARGWTASRGPGDDWKVSGWGRDLSQLPPSQQRDGAQGGGSPGQGGQGGIQGRRWGPSGQRGRGHGCGAGEKVGSPK